MAFTLLPYIGSRVVASYVFGLWFCWFVAFSLVQCVTVLKVFVGARACCLVVGNHGPLSPAGNRTPAVQPVTRRSTQ
jgi:hypothetical protein